MSNDIDDRIRHCRPVVVAVKHDHCKPRPELAPPLAMLEVGRVLAHGAQKYGQHNWIGGLKWLRLAGAAQRHLLAWLYGVDLDPESECSHLAHAICALLFLLEFQLRGRDDDDDRLPEVKP